MPDNQDSVLGDSRRRVLVTHSPEETFALAEEIGKGLLGGEIFLLRGELGAGKTVFAKGLASGLSLDPADVTSPSFTLVNVHRGRLQLYHIDLYRLESGGHDGLGIEEIFDNRNAVTVVEWAERLTSPPANAIEVRMSWVSDCERKVEIEKPAEA